MARTALVTRVTAELAATFLSRHAQRALFYAVLVALSVKVLTLDIFASPMAGHLYPMSSIAPCAILPRWGLHYAAIMERHAVSLKDSGIIVSRTRLAVFELE